MIGGYWIRRGDERNERREGMFVIFFFGLFSDNGIFFFFLGELFYILRKIVRLFIIEILGFFK